MAFLKIKSINCRGLNTDEKRLKVYTWLNDSEDDIIFLQETHYIKDNEFKYNARWNGKSYHCFSDSVFSRGVSILFRKGIIFDALSTHKSSDGRKLLLNISIDDHPITLVNVYAPNNQTDRCEFFKRMQTWVSQHANTLENLILCGDFNCVLDNSSDKSSNVLKKCLSKLNFCDMWNELHPQKTGYTWCDASDIPKSRIDYIFISKLFMYDVRSIIIRRIPGTHSNGTRMSDHRCLSLRILLNKNERGPGYWKLNVSLLNDETFVLNMKSYIKNFDNLSEDPQVSWENLKHRYQILLYKIFITSK